MTTIIIGLWCRLISHGIEIAVESRITYVAPYCIVDFPRKLNFLIIMIAHITQ